MFGVVRKNETSFSVFADLSGGVRAYMKQLGVRDVQMNTRVARMNSFIVSFIEVEKCIT